MAGTVGTTATIMPTDSTGTAIDAGSGTARSSGGDWLALRSQLQDAGVRWPAGLERWLDALLALLQAGQAQTNLVGDASAKGLASHVAEALVLAQLVETVRGHAPQRAADVGAGAGLQGLTWSQYWPEASIALVEPRSKRAQFAHQTASALGLARLQVIQRSLSVAGLQGQLDFASARAVWPLPDWLPNGRALLRPGGVLGAHVRGPLADWQTQWDALQRTEPALRGWQLLASAEVPGPRRNVVAVMRPRT